MSKYASYNMKALKNQEVLIAALNAMGLKQVEVHEEPVQLRDYYGALNPTPAHIVVRKQQFAGVKADNCTAFVDVGFARNADGSFTVLADGHYPVKMKDGTLFTDALPLAYARVNADKAVRTVLTKTIPGLKARGVIPNNATAERQAVGNTTRIVVSY